MCVKIRKNSKEENNKYILSKNNSIKFELNKTTNDTWLLEYKDKQYEKIESDLAQNRIVQDFINQNDIFKNIKDIINLNVSYKYVVKYKLLDYLAEYNTIRNQLNNPNMLNRKAILEVLISNIILLINAIRYRKFDDAQKLEDTVITIEIIKDIDLYISDFMSNNTTIDNDNIEIVKKIKNKLIDDLTRAPNKRTIKSQRYTSFRQKIYNFIGLTNTTGENL